MSYNSDSAADRLSAVRDAIAKVLAGQRYKIGDRELERARLQDLRDMERELMRESDQASGGLTLGQID